MNSYNIDMQLSNDRFQGMSAKVKEVAIMGGNVHLAEHNEYEENRMTTGEFDEMEAIMGASWNCDYFNEWILTDRDVWVRNPMYQGPTCPVDPQGDCYPTEEERNSTDPATIKWVQNFNREMDQYHEELALYESHINEAMRLDAEVQS